MKEQNLATTNEARKNLKFRGTECLNCGHPLELSNRYCPNCSQANSTKKLSLVDYFDEFFANYISYDSKLLKTLSALLLKPGSITKAYINGKRVSYTNPFRFLLSLAIIFFLILGVTGNFEQMDQMTDSVNIDSFDLKSTIDTMSFETAEEKEIALSTIDSLNLGELLVNYQQAIDSNITSDPAAYFKSIDSNNSPYRVLKKLHFFRNTFKFGQTKNFDQISSKFNIEPTNENKLTFALANSLSRIEQQPSLFVRNFISRIPFSIFFFLPVFSFFIWLMYIRKSYTYTDHLIFSFHNTSLLFILLIISYLIDNVFNTNSNWLFMSVFSIYLFQAMRRFYEQGVFKTIVKYLSLNAIFFILAMFTTLLLIAGNIITY